MPTHGISNRVELNMPKWSRRMDCGAVGKENKKQNRTNGSVVRKLLQQVKVIEELKKLWIVP